MIQSKFLFSGRMGSLALLLALCLPVSAQKARVIGHVQDKQSGSPLGFASLRLMQETDSQVVVQGLSAADGAFTLEALPGSYLLEVAFMGYQTAVFPDISLKSAADEADLGTIALELKALDIEEVVIEGEKSSMEFSLDKRIFNVGKDLSNAGSTASDILANIPSVSVDAEGNVKLRGSDNVRILIDGKPSGLVSFKGGSGLQQLQGSLIERVEVITNPSARYEAEGNAGVINIVLKKEKKQGFNGSFEVITGQPANYGASANLNYRRRNINFFINYGIFYRIQPNVGSLYQELYDGDTTRYLFQRSQGEMTGFNNNIKGGLDFYINDKNVLTASYMLRRSDAHRITNFTYEDYLLNTSNLSSITQRQQDETEDEPNSEYILSYRKNFERKGHELLADLRYLDYWENSDQTFTQSSTFGDGSPNPGQTLIQKALNDETEKQWLFQLDYLQPIGKEGKFETGVRSSFRDMTNNYAVTQQEKNGEWSPVLGLNNNFIYNENIHAAYGILGNSWKKISYQAGLRAEFTDIQTELVQTQQLNPRSYANLFPSAHLTWKLPQDHALQLSYSRRVRRPRYNELSPFVTYSDNRNFFAGNPDLNPEFSQVIDMGHLKYFEKASISSSVYYRHTRGKVERIRTVDEAGVASTLPQNLLSEDAFGAEFTATFTPFSWWKLDVNANFFRAITDGSNINANIGSDTYSWFARQTSRFTLPGNIDFQVRGNYEAPQLLPQGRRKALYYLDLAANKDLFKGNGTLTLNATDVFNTRRMRMSTTGEDFYTYSDSQWRRRQINLTFTYRLNQSKNAGKPRRNLDGDEGGGS
ncbi:MAG: TonB-dependent receptor [Bacteroidetes bacterium]|nr:MAG: TonB-dependent receptor [Bacteroidota bacterium]